MDEKDPAQRHLYRHIEFDFVDIDETRQTDPDDPNDILCPANFLESRVQGNLARSQLLDPRLFYLKLNLISTTKYAEEAVLHTDTPLCVFV